MPYRKTKRTRKTFRKRRVNRRRKLVSRIPRFYSGGGNIPNKCIIKATYADSLSITAGTATM